MMPKITVNPEKKSHISLFIKYGLIGGITAAFHFFIFWLAFEIFLLHYVVSISLSYLFSSAFHFFGNSHFTFDAGDGKQLVQFARYLIMFLINYVITFVVVQACVEKLHFSAYFGVCASISITIFVGYLMGRYWVFKINKEIL
jgi:putative flippase GtrA